MSNLIFCRGNAFEGLAMFLMLLLAARPSLAEDTNEEEQIRALQQRNAILEQKVEKQDESIEILTEKVNELETTNASRPGTPAENYAPAPTSTGYNLGNVNLSGEGGIAFFNTGPQGFAPDSEFRVDEARLFVEAPIWKEVYFSGELDLATREYRGWDVRAGEVYLDWQDLSDLWGRDGQLNLRAGRIYIPFGQEYLRRYAIDNPLISHSVSDLWGYSPGVELYGALSRFNYVVAVQNANDSGASGIDGDKSVSGRIGFNLNQHWQFSVSAMRTGNLNTKDHMLSAMWFGNGFFQSLGGPGTTWFHDDLVEGDIISSWSSGYVWAFGGYGHYNDNDPLANNARDFFYYSVEGLQDLPKKFYAVVRFSEALSNKGVPIVGFGNPGDYFSALTTELWRLSLGAGYRFSPNFVLKVEYSFEGGQNPNGETRDEENFFGTEAAFRF